MEYPFPPPPPGYTSVLVARWLLVIWAVIGVGILIIRLRHWKFLRIREMVLWSSAAIISVVVSKFGICQYRAFDRNDWLAPAEVAAISVSVAGIAMGLSKLYSEGSEHARKRAMELSVVAFFVALFCTVLNEDPSIGHARGERSRFDCKTNLRQLGLAMYNYHDAFESLAPSSTGNVPVTWRVSLLPFLDQRPLFEEYDRHTPWDSDPNEKIALRLVERYFCRANYFEQHAQGRWFTPYSMPTGPHTVGGNSSGTPSKNVTDGLSNTLLIVEACGSQIIWTEPRDVDAISQPAGINLKGKKPGNSSGWLSSYHLGGTQVTFADGSVRFLSANIDPSVLKKLATIDDGEILRSDEF